MATGGRYALEGGGDTPDVLSINYEFPDFTLNYEAVQLNGHGVGGRTPGMKYYQARGGEDRPHGAAFFGTRGSLFVDRIGLEVYPEWERERDDEGVLIPRGERRTIAGADATEQHAANFIACVRSRKAPAAEAAIGHASSIVPHLGNIAYRTGEKLTWDAEREAFVNSPAGSALLYRQPRPKWDIFEGV